MSLDVRGKNLEVTFALSQYIEQKIGKITKYFDETTDHNINVVISVIRDSHIVEVNATLEGQHLRAQAQSADMYASIDLVEEKLERQVRKLKTKLNRKGRRDNVAEDQTADYLINDDEEEIVRVKRFDMKPMDAEEAILQMNLLGHQFFVFREMNSQKMNVVYKRNDGKYALIVAE